MPLLFSYGTLQKHEVQMKLFGRIITGHKDFLTGYKMAAIEINDQTFLANGEDKQQQTLLATHNDRNVVEGTALELTEEELVMADKYEPSNYQRKKVELQSGKEAWIYLAT